MGMAANFERLLAVDPSLTCSGWALFEVDSGALRAVGKVRALPPSVPLAERLNDIQSKVGEILNDWSLGDRDILVCEAQTTVRDPHAAFKVEHVRGIFESVARERSMVVPGRINPRTVHRELMGLRGRQLARAIVKEAAQRTALALYGPVFEEMGLLDSAGGLKGHQDIIDATLVGSLAVARVVNATRASLALTHAFAPRPRERIGRRMNR